MRIKRDPLDILFSHYIKQRDKVCQARIGLDGQPASEGELCGRSFGKLDAAHCFGRGRKSVRWDEENSCLLCFTHHQWYDHHDTEKRAFFRKRLGDKEFDLLEGRMRITWPKPDKVLLAIYYQNKLRGEG